MNFKSLLGLVGRVLTPLWKGAARLVLSRESADLRGKVKALIDDDKDASIVRVNRIFDGWQTGIIKGLRGLSFLPAAIANTIIDGVQSEGDKLQARVVDAVKSKGPAAVDLAFDGLEARLSALIDHA